MTVESPLTAASLQGVAASSRGPSSKSRRGQRSHRARRSLTGDHRDRSYQAHGRPIDAYGDERDALDNAVAGIHEEIEARIKAFAVATSKARGTAAPHD